MDFTSRRGRSSRSSSCATSALPLWAAGTLGALGTGIIAVACDSAVLTPLRRAKAPELSSFVVTLGGVLLLNNLMLLIFGAEVRRFPVTLLSQSPISLGRSRSERFSSLSS